MDTSKHILFVDDDAAILASLKNMLRRERDRWSMHFAVGAEAALAVLESHPIDVIVSDLRMPGIDGPELLARTRRDHPEPVRMVLSGFADQAMIFRTLPVAHQCLAKPCEPADLRGALARAGGLHRWLPDRALRSDIHTLSLVPPNPTVFAALVDLLSSRSVDEDDVVEIVETDPAIAAKVLQLVNGSCLGPRERTLSVAVAVRYLGIELLRRLVHVPQAFASPDATVSQRVRECLGRTLPSARLAARFLHDPARAELAFAAALLRDIGMLVLSTLRGAAYDHLIDTAIATGRPLEALEVETWGVSHAEVGAYLLGLWGLPDPIIVCVGHHHRPGALTDGPLDVLAAVHVADVLVPSKLQRGSLDLGVLDLAGLGPELPRWRSLAAPEARAL